MDGRSWPPQECGRILCGQVEDGWSDGGDLVSSVPAAVAGGTTVAGRGDPSLRRRWAYPLVHDRLSKGGVAGPDRRSDLSALTGPRPSLQYRLWSRPDAIGHSRGNS